MLDANKIMEYIVDCLKDYNENNETVSGGLELFFEDYKIANKDKMLTFDGFMNWQSFCHCFAYTDEPQKSLLINWGASVNDNTDVEMCFFRAIWPYFKAVVESYKQEPRIYTVYAEHDNMTFIMKETKINDGKTKLEVIGFYYGKPNKSIKTYKLEYKLTLK